jgi:hypothetical protein
VGLGTSPIPVGVVANEKSPPAAQETP